MNTDKHFNVLVTGGAGYIGSHAVRQLRAAGHRPVVVDNLFRGHREAVPDDVPFHPADMAETDRLAAILDEHRIDCVMHFAALTYVGESVAEPLRYYENNTAGAISMLRAMAAAGVKRFVFSSTAAVYGEPEEVPITEACPQRPINPYGHSKWMVERVLRDLAAADPEFGGVALRYFNVAGCAADGSLGEDHEPETHLIPAILQAALGRRERLTIFGDDYPTPDGTCIRDYIHVEDLCDAHILAMDAFAPGSLREYNLGIGRGYSVREVFDAAAKVVGREIPVEMGPRRPGDPAVLYADSSKIQRELGWTPRYLDIEAIIETAWRWFEMHPVGYVGRRG
ncbi:MAG TPA: UDP-glucose 4-epimerase GalE [Planctomycetaceae bacterium]|nr:UDP-glucose 4-epimerase GalE [Planctomycetaceae bacterium]